MYLDWFNPMMRGSSAQQCMWLQRALLLGALAACNAHRDAEERAGGTNTCGCVSGSVGVSLVAEVQYSTGAVHHSLVMFSGFKLP